MKRLHVHIAVEDLEKSIGFYSALFGAEPTKQKPDYAKWMLDDPRVNFAISCRGAKPGLDHLGIQVDAPEELEDLREHLKRADLGLFGEGETVCCYAASDKSWVQDPSGVAWETYHTMVDSALFSHAKDESAATCCVRKVEEAKSAAPTSCGAGAGCC